MVYPALLPLMCTPRLPVVNWTDAPADLNGLVCFAERQNLVSARVPSHFKHSLPDHKIPFCYVICIIAFVRHSCVILMQLYQFSCISWEWHRHAHLVCKLCLRFFWMCCQSCTNFIHFFLIYHNVNCMFSYSLKWNHFPQIFLNLYTHYFCVWIWHIQKFWCEFIMAFLVANVFGLCTTQKTAYRQQMDQRDLWTSPISSLVTRWHSDLLYSISILIVSD